MRLLKSSLLIGTATAVLITAYSSYAQIAAKSRPDASSQSAPLTRAPHSDNLSLGQADQELLFSLVERSVFGNADQKLAAIDAQWSAAFIPPTIEMFNFISNGEVRDRLQRKLVESTGQDFGTNMNAWFKWLWNEPELKIEGYDNFKSEFYRRIDPKFGRYFEGRAATARIRLDEIRWGGVRQDGIPPLRNPKMLPAFDFCSKKNNIAINVFGQLPAMCLAWL